MIAKSARERHPDQGHWAPVSIHAWISAPLRDKPSVVRRERLYQRFVRPMDAYPADLHGTWAYAHLFPGLFLDLYPDQYDTWQMVPVAPMRSSLFSTFT